jgi:hypothetical protein
MNLGKRSTFVVSAKALSNVVDFKRIQRSLVQFVETDAFYFAFDLDISYWIALRAEIIEDSSSLLLKLFPFVESLSLRMNSGEY